jgi:hypothetical protein
VQSKRPETKKSRNILNRFEDRLEKLGLVPAALVLSVIAVLGAMLVHIVLRTLEGQPLTGAAIFNILVKGSVVAVPLTLGAPAPDGGYALCIRDTGVGMTESEIAVALTPFGQNHGKMASRREGTGLGLPLAKAMIELHGGSLTVESQPNRGTAVTLTFPADRVVRPKGQKAA